MSETQVWGTEWPLAIRAWKTCPLCKKKIKPPNQPDPKDTDVTKHLCTCEI